MSNLTEKTANYPFPQPWDSKKDGEWRDITLFGIAGWFAPNYKTYFSNWAMAFGGYFKLAKDNKSLVGEIIDMWGNAKIEGKLEADKILRFGKLYINGPHQLAHSGLIHYRFEKKGNLWEGRFILSYVETLSPYVCPDDGLFEQGDGSKGIAMCQIHPVVDNAFGILIGPIGQKL